MKKNLLFLLTLAVFFSCSKEETPSVLDDQLNNLLIDVSSGIGVDAFILPSENDLASIPQDPKNPITAEKVKLGQLLFHETGIALAPMQDFNKGTFSCASCHFAGAGFQAGTFQGIGDGGLGFGVNGEGRVKNNLSTAESLDVQPIRSPTIMNGAYQKNMLWNGQFGATGLNVDTEDAWTADTPKENNFLGFEGLETQAIAGLGVHRLVIDSNLVHETDYKNLFDAAFPDSPVEDRYTRINAGLAIAAYERTVLSNQAPFQEWLKGNMQAMSDEEKKGAILFFGKAECASCHNSPALNSMEFHAVGMKDLYECPEETFQSSADNAQNLGRGGFTGKTEDEYKFKVPQLYNLKDSPFYGHGASFRSIEEVVSYFNKGIAEKDNVPVSQMSSHFKPLQLSEEELSQITTFLSEALYDPTLKRYEPEGLPSGNCFPNNDAQSRADLGCD